MRTFASIAWGLYEPLTPPMPPQAQIIREDPVHALRAYHGERDPRRRGWIFRNDLSPALDRGEPMPLARALPLKGAQDVGTLAGDLVSQRTLELVFSKRPMLGAVSADFSDEVANYNQKIYTRTVAAPTVVNLGGAVSEATDTDLELQLDLLKEVRFEFTALEWAATTRNLVQEHAEVMAVALGSYLVDQIALLLTDAFAAETIKASAAVDYTTVSGITAAMNTAGVPDTGRFGVVNSAVADAFRNDDIIMQYGARDSANAYAVWKGFEGFQNLWEFPALPDNSVHLTGFFASRSALLVATRLLAKPGYFAGLEYPGRIEVITEPVSGLSVLSNTYVDQLTFKIGTRLILLGGVARGQVGCAHRLVSEA